MRHQTLKQNYGQNNRETFGTKDFQESRADVLADREGRMHLADQFNAGSSSSQPDGYH